MAKQKKTPEQLDREIAEALHGGARSNAKSLKYKDAGIEKMFQEGGPSGDDAKVAILGDPMYVRHFKMPKWNISPSVLNTADVAIRHHNELGIPTSKSAHRQRADYFRALRARFEKEHQRLLGEYERAYGKNGALVTGGMRDDWPSAAKDRVRFVAQGLGTLGDAIRLHEALSKTRSPAFH